MVSNSPLYNRGGVSSGFDVDVTAVAFGELLYLLHNITLGWIDCHVSTTLLGYLQLNICIHHNKIIIIISHYTRTCTHNTATIITAIASVQYVIVIVPAIAYKGTLFYSSEHISPNWDTIYTLLIPY